jgi:hypothetical protein
MMVLNNEKSMEDDTMKKIWLAAAVLIITVAASIFVYRSAFSYAYIDKANENMDMGELKLLMKPISPEKMKDKGFSDMGGFGCYPYENTKDGLEIIFSGFPDCVNEYVLTNINTTSTNYHFYGIHIGDDAKKAEDILISNGFSKVNENSDNKYIQFKKRKMVVSFPLNEEGKIKEIIIVLQSTNKQGVVF